MAAKVKDRNRFEQIINSIEEARDIARELKEDLLLDSLDSILEDLEIKYMENYV